MSLDVYLYNDFKTKTKSTSGIFVRENGQTKEITEDEYKNLYPDRDPMVLTQDKEGEDVYWANITHNLGKMASEAGLYEALWRPEEIEATTAKDLIGKLALGIDVLKRDPEHFKKFNPENGWGDYEGLINFVQNYLDACYDNQDAKIRVSR